MAKILLTVGNLDNYGDNELPDICFKFDAWLAKQLAITDTGARLETFERDGQKLIERYLAELAAGLARAEIEAKRIPDEQCKEIPF